jgi:hypothetical protein
MSHLKDMTTWIKRLGRTKLRTFTNANGHFWLDQNATKPSKWGSFAHSGHAVAWECNSLGGKYTGRMLVDGEVYTLAAATKKFVCKAKK